MTEREIVSLIREVDDLPEWVKERSPIGDTLRRMKARHHV